LKLAFQHTPLAVKRGNYRMAGAVILHTILLDTLLEVIQQT